MAKKQITQFQAQCLQAQYDVRRSVWIAKRQLGLTPLTFEEYLLTLSDETD